MGIFSSKPKVDMESFCKHYYDSQMFHAIADGEDGSQKILNASLQLLIDSDPLFSKIDRALFECEMTAMHLELFALAFFKRCSNFEHAIKQNIFTLHYLQNKDRSDIWEVMGKYNTVIAQTATMNASGQQMTGAPAAERMTITQVNEIRSSLGSKWMQSYFNDRHDLSAEEEGIAACIARACNRIAADIMRNNEIGNRRIAALFLYRIGAGNIWGKNWQPSKDLLVRIASQPYSMYDFATQVLKTANLQFS
jgi:hypothetical protein